MTRADLITQVLRFGFSRTDLGDMIDTYILLAEAEMRVGTTMPVGTAPGEPLRIPELIKTVSLTLTGGRVPLPADFEASVRVMREGDRLRYVPPGSNDLEYSSCNDAFTIEGLELVSHVEDCELTYYADFEPLVEDSDTNIVLKRHLPIYLHGVLFQLFTMTDYAEKAAFHSALFVKAIRAANRTGRNSRIPMEGVSI